MSALERDLSRCRLQEAGQQAGSGALAAPRLTDNRECLALLDREVHSIHRLNRPHLPTQNPGADREVLDQSFDNDQVRVRLGPASAGRCAGAVTASAQSRVPRSARVRSGIDAGHGVAGFDGASSGEPPRCDLVSRGKGAARVEWAAGRHMDEAGGVPGIAAAAHFGAGQTAASTRAGPRCRGGREC